MKVSIPECAAEIYSNDSMYRRQINNLDQIVFMYNEIVSTLNAVEEPLIRKNIEKIDKVLEPGISVLMWESKNVDIFIKKALKIVEDVYKIVKKMKSDLEKIKQNLEEFNTSLVSRKIKSVSPEEFFTSHQASVS